LRAPFDGFIAQKLTENFETVEIGQPVVVFLDCSVLEVTVGIPEELLTQKDGFQRFECRFDVLPKTVVQGKLKELGRKPNHGSQTYPLTVEFTPPEQCKIQPGMTASLEIFFKSSSETNRFVLPIEAVVASEPETPYVWTVDPAQQTAHKTNVTVGDLSSRGIEIREGLSSGQWVVTAGAHFLEENQRVHLQHSNSQ
jgi:RND family efflux transporter MFP subunit